MSAYLSLLSPELLVNILQSLTSARDLDAIVKASSQFYRVFAAYKQSIVSSILLHAIPQEVELNFVLAYRAQRIWKLVPEDEERRGGYRRRRYQELFDSLNQESTTILDQYKSGKGEQLYELVSDRALLLDIWKFYSSFEHLLVSYGTRALSDLQQSSCVSNMLLSFTEQARLQRAFFRWEIYTCLFQVSQLSGNGPLDQVPSTDPAPRFAAMLHPWEVEELSCVAQFYKVLMEELSDRIEEDFVTMAKEKMDARPDVGGEKNDIGGLLDWFCLWWYDESFKRSQRPWHIDYLVSRGMLAVRKLTNAPFPIVRRMIVNSGSEAKGKISILARLDHFEYQAEGEEDEGEISKRHPAEDNSDDECLEHCNFGWLWAVGNEKTKWRWDIDLPSNYELRNRGYVFWDEARLRKCKEFQSPRDPVKDDFEFPSDYQEHSKQPGIQTKLKDTLIHGDVLREMSDEIVFRQIEGDGPSVTGWRD
ncbi:hypothetical protein F9C07_1475496 [Aspergillus flavus]|uniref:F-box domain-containing protein n=2 Tax=Aspergillus subgen. Circumdati TaxID=2720871 RepID=A0A7G5K3E2_ASPFN|nr:uncharacterized protein G4B84_005647 [Aspergillus flavus NRRL3357]KAJ1711087.1 hypothetical protein NYO67_6754 [Aspergillus flavus]OOO15063.1 hypothetical protein OAory_01036580 [Aspergillus oryzae]KAF7620833.1 hypothetical protein AFLA_006128 [Aspergillus flavus NRRL3357]QMW30312.1 hypothetical protein G4B84_005647 [Aspergillus flavus NRRL3357]QMW42384.1 hypothetical protein G4B11_005708 [Aspergillus flavus]